MYVNISQVSWGFGGDKSRWILLVYISFIYKREKEMITEPNWKRLHRIYKDYYLFKIRNKNKNSRLLRSLLEEAERFLLLKEITMWYQSRACFENIKLRPTNRATV